VGPPPAAALTAPMRSRGRRRPRCVRGWAHARGGLAHVTRPLGVGRREASARRCVGLPACRAVARCWTRACGSKSSIALCTSRAYSRDSTVFADIGTMPAAPFAGRPRRERSGRRVGHGKPAFILQGVPGRDRAKRVVQGGPEERSYDAEGAPQGDATFKLVHVNTFLEGSYRRHTAIHPGTTSTSWSSRPSIQTGTSAAAANAQLGEGPARADRADRRRVLSDVPPRNLTITRPKIPQKGTRRADTRAGARCVAVAGVTQGHARRRQNVFPAHQSCAEPRSLATRVAMHPRLIAYDANSTKYACSAC
jgi:hypothetical protein